MTYRHHEYDRFDCALTHRSVTTQTEIVELRGDGGVTVAVNEGRKRCLDKGMDCNRNCVFLSGVGNPMALDPKTGLAFNK